MNYELTKELKDAGFPNIVNGDGNWTVPTLSELIEACGENGFEFLMRDGAQWQASTPCPDGTEGMGENRTDGFGSTPEEAVANLWIMLNGK